MRCQKQKSMKSCTRQCSETSTCTKPRGHFARVLTISKETLALERHLRHQKQDSWHLERRNTASSGRLIRLKKKLHRKRQTNASRGSLGRFCGNYTSIDGIRLTCWHLLFWKKYSDKNLTFKCFHMKKVQVSKQLLKLLKERSQLKQEGSWKTRSLLKNIMSVYMKGIKVLHIGNLTNRKLSHSV